MRSFPNQKGDRMLQVRRTVPSYHDLIWPVVMAYRALGGASDKEQLLDKVAELMMLNDEVMLEPHGQGPKTELGYRVAWVQTWLRHGGMLENPRRGVWALTSLGRAVNQEEAETVGPKRTRTIVMNRATAIAEEAEPPEPDHAGAIAEMVWQAELLETIKAMDPSAFERLAKRLLLELGFSKVTVTGRSGDGGIDAVGTVTVNSVLTFKVVVQCKRYRDTVGANDLRNFRGAMQGRTDKALFITTGTFTRGALEEATRDGVPEIDLINGEDLTAILKELKLGIKTEMVERVSVVKEFFAEI